LRPQWNTLTITLTGYEQKAGVVHEKRTRGIEDPPSLGSSGQARTRTRTRTTGPRPTPLPNPLPSEGRGRRGGRGRRFQKNRKRGGLLHRAVSKGKPG